MANTRQHSHHYIYKTTCKVTGRYYIGMHSTSNLEDGYIGSGRRLWLSINKHGKENHTKEILEFLPDRQALKARERELVNEDQLIDPMCMNLQLGGEGGFSTVEHQLKCSAAGGRTTNPEKSKKASEKMKESNRKMMELGTHHTPNWTGKHHRPEIRELIGLNSSIKQKGSGNSQFGTKWMTHPEHGTIKVKAEERPQFLVLGYRDGRKIMDK